MCELRQSKCIAGPCNNLIDKTQDKSVRSIVPMEVGTSKNL